MKSGGRKKYVMMVIFFLPLFLALFGFIFLNQPIKASLTLDNISDKTKVDSDFKLKFDWPVKRQVSLVFEPSVSGQLVYEDFYYSHHLSRTIIFKPDYDFAPETDYQVTVNTVENALPSLISPQQFTYKFTTEALPKITQVIPATAELIRADEKFEVALDKPNNDLAAFAFIFEPSLKAKITLNNDNKSYLIVPEEILSQGQKYQLTVTRANRHHFYQQDEISFEGDAEKVWQGEWQVREAPYLSDFSPAGRNILLNSPIAFIFNEAVDLVSLAEKVSIEPAVAGQWQDAGQNKYVYTAENGLAKETSYTVKISAHLKTSLGGFLEEEAVHAFTTVGPVKLTAYTPADDRSGVPISSAIRLDFDQPVDKTSAQNHFRIQPEAAGDFIWDGQTMIFEPSSPLSFNTTYTYSLSPGIAGPAGYPSEMGYAISFATELSLTKLAVPFHHQEHRLSCEIATLVMALAYRGISASEQEIIDVIGFDPTPKANGVWGNPHIAFVGDIDGHQPSTGYGVYWQPIAKAGNRYRTTRWFSGGTLVDLMNEIKAGNPVIIWGTAGSGSRIDWKTSQGSNVVAINGEHTMVVIGYIGSAEDPAKIIVLDPLSGERHFTKSSFLWNWSLLNRSGVVVE